MPQFAPLGNGWGGWKEDVSGIQVRLSGFRQFTEQVALPLWALVSPAGKQVFLPPPRLPGGG